MPCSTLHLAKCIKGNKCVGLFWRGGLFTSVIQFASKKLLEETILKLAAVGVASHRPIASNGHLFPVDVNSSSAIRTTRETRPAAAQPMRPNLRPADQVQKEEETRPGRDMLVSAATSFCCVARQKLPQVTVILFRSEPPHHPRPSLSIGRKSMRPCHPAALLSSYDQIKT